MIEYTLYKIEDKMCQNLQNIKKVNKYNKNIDKLINDFIQKYENNSINKSNYSIIEVYNNLYVNNLYVNNNNNNLYYLINDFLDKYRNELLQKKKYIKLYLDNSKKNIFCVFNNKLFVTNNNGTYIIYRNDAPLVIQKLNRESTIIKNKKSNSICNLLKNIN